MTGQLHEKDKPRYTPGAHRAVAAHPDGNKIQKNETEEFLSFFFCSLVSLRQDRITDHRAGYSRHGWDAMMRGELLEDFLAALAEKDRLEQLKAAGLQTAPSPPG